MKVSEIIDYVDTVEPNGFDAELKLEWLRDLDRKVYEQVICTHAQPIVENWTAPEGLDDELIIPAPYARDAYEFYLRAKIAASNLEDVRYNQYTIMFNGAYAEFTRAYNREHLPLSGYNLFKF